MIKIVAKISLVFNADLGRLELKQDVNVAVIIFVIFKGAEILNRTVVESSDSLNVSVEIFASVLPRLE